VNLNPNQFGLRKVFSEPGREGERSHITYEESGTVPTSVVANMPGRMGEVPGEHRNKRGQEWDEFKNDIGQHGIKNPLFVMVFPDEDELSISEGNHRRDAAVELGHEGVPVTVRYFGHAERKRRLYDGER
jgi:hypothetical protein